MSTSRPAFTLIELLIVVSVIAILAGMATAMLGTVKRQGMRTDSEVTMRKVGTAIRMFRSDTGVLPYQAVYPEPGASGTAVHLVAGWNDYPASVDASQPFRNNLFRRLGHSLDDTEHQALNVAVETAAGKFAFYGRTNSANLAVMETGSTLAFQPSSLLPPSQVHKSRDSDASTSARYSSYLNRVGADRARRAVLAGALDLEGPVIAGPTSASAQVDLSTTALLCATERSGLTTGWCDDYLDGGLRPKDRSGDAVLDAYGRPLVYVGQVVPRARSTSAQICDTTVKSQDLVWYGLGAAGFRAHTGPWADLVAAKRWRLLQSGRLTVGALALDNLASPTGSWNPGPPMDSDRRWFAAPGLEQDCELWSAGPDGRLDWARSATSNRDNIPLLPYDRRLQ